MVWLGVGVLLLLSVAVGLGTGSGVSLLLGAGWISKSVIELPGNTAFDGFCVTVTGANCSILCKSLAL